MERGREIGRDHGVPFLDRKILDLRDELEEAGEEGVPSALIQSLEERWRRQVAAMAAGETVRPILEAAVERCGQGQLQTHRAARAGTKTLRDWAEQLPDADGYRWWEAAAGASSSVAAHALIAAAATRGTTAGDAAALDAAYNPPIGALTVLLDDLVDLEEDREASQHNYVGYYADPKDAAERLAWIADRARQSIEPLAQSARHEAILAGVAAFYLSAPSTDSPVGRPIRIRMLATLGPGARLLVAFMRLRRGGERKRPGRAGSSPGP